MLYITFLRGDYCFFYHYAEFSGDLEEQTRIRLMEAHMSEKQILYYIKNESNSELLYLVAVTCLERMADIGKVAGVKAVLDAGTNILFNMIKKDRE